MYSVILADDEPMILEGLTCLVPWETIGFEIKVKAYDGDELISVVKEYQPDVLITDIQMPFKTGLECIEEIKQISPDTIILILPPRFSYISLNTFLFISTPTVFNAFVTCIIEFTKPSFLLF